MVDYYSDWFEVDLLNEDIIVVNVIFVIKVYFVCYGILDIFLLDNGFQYIFQEFLNFVKIYGFKLIIWLLYYVRVIGKVEVVVKEVKKMLKKLDFFMGFLDYRNMLFQGMIYFLV